MKDTTKALLQAVGLDVFPSFATVVNFGIRSSQELGAYQWGWRHECFTNEELDEASGCGPKLTELVNRSNGDGYDNPYACTIKTMWDDMPEGE